MTDQSKRAAMVGYTFFGCDERLKRHVRALREIGVQTDVITLRNPRGEGEQPQEGVRFFLPRARDYRRQGKAQILLDYILFTLAAMRILLRNTFADGRYDVVHINNMPNFILFAALPLRLLGTRVLLDVHDTMPEIYQERFGVSARHWMIRALFLEERLCMRLADFVLTTEATKHARLLENGLSPGKSAVTLNLADTTVFPCPVIVRRPAGAGRPFRVVYHGTLTRRLGVDIALHAIAEARETIPNLRFEVYGDGEQRDALLALRAELGLEDSVYFSDGFLPMETLIDRLAGADAGIVPSRNNVATELMLPVKLLEYVQLGIPIVAVPTRTIRHYFSEEMATFVPPEAPGEIATALAGLYRDPERSRRQAACARTFFDRHTFLTERKRYQRIVQLLPERGRLGAGAPWEHEESSGQVS